MKTKDYQRAAVILAIRAAEFRHIRKVGIKSNIIPLMDEPINFPYSELFRVKK